MNKVEIKGLPQAVVDRLPDSGSSLLFLGYRGSDSHGTKLPKSDPNSVDDTDLIGVYCESPEHYLGFGRRDTIEFWEGEYDVVLYELRKFMHLTYKQNPNVLGVLWSADQHILHSSPEFERIREQRSIFASRKAHASFVGYATSQLKKMTQHANPTEENKATLLDIEEEMKFRECRTQGDANHNLEEYRNWSLQKLRARRNELKGQAGYMGEKRRRLVDSYGYDVKNAAHLIRLLRMAVEFLDSGEMFVDRTGRDAEEIMAIKRGDYPLRWIETKAKRLFTEAGLALENSPLPEEPDRDAIEELLVDLVKSRIVHGDKNAER